MNAAFQPTRMRISVDRYQQMVTAGVLTKNDRVELIEGVIVNMAPVGIKHAAVTARLNRLFVQYLGERAIVSPGGPVDLGHYSEPQPDLMLLKPRADFYEGKVPESSDALLVVEVSDSSLSYDQTEKLRLYGRYGIQEYWVVDVNAKLIIAYRRPTDDGYAERIEKSAPELLSPLAFSDLTIAVADVVP